MTCLEQYQESCVSFDTYIVPTCYVAYVCYGELKKNARKTFKVMNRCALPCHMQICVRACAY